MSQGLAEAFASPLQPSYRGNPNVSDLLQRDYNPSQPMPMEPMPLPNQNDKMELTPLTLEQAFANPPQPQPTSLEQAFANPLTPEVNNVMQIEGESYELPTQFFTLSEEEQAKIIETLTGQIKANNKQKQKIEEFKGDALDIGAITAGAEQGIQTYGDVTGNMVLDTASSIPGGYAMDRALNAMQSVGTKVPAAARVLGPLGASMAAAPEAKDFLTGQGGYDPNKHGISLEPILPSNVDVGRIPYHFNRAIFGTHDPIGDSLRAMDTESPRPF